MSLSMLMPTLMYASLFMVFFYGFAGRYAALTYMAAQLASTAVLINPTFMWLVLLAGSLPAVLICQGIARRRPFFEQLRTALIICVLGLAAAVLVAFSVYGGNLIGRLSEAMRAQFDQIPDEYLAPIVDAFNGALSNSGLSGLMSFTVDTYKSQIIALVATLYGQTLPGALISGILLTAVLSVAWGNWLYARRGLASADSYASIDRWYLPAQATVALLVLLFGGYAFSAAGSDGTAVYSAIRYTVNSAFCIQAVAATCRYMTRRGISEGKRNALAGVLITLGVALRFIYTPLSIAGMASALFGSHGALRRARRESNDDKTGDDDPEQ